MSDVSERSLRGLLSDLGQTLSVLFRQEIALARAETSEKVTQVAVAVGALAGSLVLALAALIILLQAIVIAITNAGLSPGWSALIVGGCTALLAFIVGYKAMNDLRASNLAPRRTVENVQRDVQAIKEHTP